MLQLQTESVSPCSASIRVAGLRFQLSRDKNKESLFIQNALVIFGDVSDSNRLLTGNLIMLLR